MNKQLRVWHRWISIFVAAPLALILVTGVILATRSFNPYLQPKYPQFQSSLRIDFDDILAIIRTAPEAKIQSWKDVSQIDIRPAVGNIRVRSRHNNWEIQMRGDTGEITSSAPRRVSWVTSIHEGAFFGPWIRYGVFLPSALGSLLLLVTGALLLLKKRKS